MTRPRHTPGPWRVHRLANGWPVITSDGHDIADLRLNGNGLPHVEANAALLAAAPQLLEALEYSVEFLEANDDGEEDVTRRIAKARAAIAKATAIGNQPTEE